MPLLIADNCGADAVWDTLLIVTAELWIMTNYSMSLLYVLCRCMLRDNDHQWCYVKPLTHGIQCKWLKVAQFSGKTTDLATLIMTQVVFSKVSVLCKHFSVEALQTCCVRLLLSINEEWKILSVSLIQRNCRSLFDCLGLFLSTAFSLVLVLVSNKFWIVQ